MKITQATQELINAPIKVATTTPLKGGEITIEHNTTTAQYLKDCSKQLGTDDLIFGDFASKYVKTAALGVFSLLKGESETQYIDQEGINEAMWKLTDEDESGYIDEDEYDSIVNSAILGYEENKFTETIAKANRAYNLAEFQEIKDSLLEQDVDIDKNKDGNLTRDEFNDSIVNHLLTKEDVE